MIDLKASEERLKERKLKVDFPSRFNHLNYHNGFRNGSLHVLVAPKGGGKSTLFRSWIMECLAWDKKVHVRLSEETVEEYQDEIYQFFSEDNKQKLENLRIDSELDKSPRDLGDQYFEDLELELKNHQAEILFFDNFTTSHLSMGSIDLQGRNQIRLRSIAQKLEIPVVVAIHTEKAFKSNMIASGDNVRGNQTIVNTAPFVYGLSVFHGHPSKPTILFIDKARGHGLANKKYFKFDMMPDFSTVKSDKLIMPSDIKEILKELTSDKPKR